MSVQKTPDRRGMNRGVNDDEIHWEEDLRPFSRLPRPPAVRPAQRFPTWLPGIVSIVIIASACGLSISTFNRNRSKLNDIFTPATATVQVLIPTPTEDIPPTATPFLAATETPIPQPTVDPSLTGGIGVGSKVRIFDTGPTGLNFRKSPSRGGEKIRSLPEGNVYEVVGGPTQADGFIWWQLKDNVDGTVGWGVQNYLQASQ